MEYKPILTNNGLKLMSVCNSDCYGTRVETYANSRMSYTQVEIFPVKNKFRIKKHGSKVYYGDLKDLETMLPKFL